MIRNKTKEILDHLTTTYEGDAQIQIATSTDTLYFPLTAYYDCADDTVLHIEDGDNHVWLCYDDIKFIKF